MRRVSLLPSSSLMAMAMIGLAATRQAAAEAPVRAVEAQGQCEASIAPDRGRLTLWAQRTEAAAGKASAETTTALAEIRAKIEALHLANASYESNGVQIEKQEIDGPKGPTGFRYQARAGLEIETSDLAGLGRAMDAAASADEIAPVSLYVSDEKRAAAIDACLPKAAADAKRTAAALLSGLDARLGPVLSVNGYFAQGGERPNSGLFDSPRPVMFRAMAAAPAPAVAEVSAWDQRITVRTTVRFAIEQTGDMAKP